MPTERMEEVEVVVPCHHCNATGEAWYTHEPRQPLGCHVCSGARCVVKKVEVAPNSLTAARLRLADAAEAWWMANEADHSREWATLLGALAALRTARGA